MPPISSRYSPLSAAAILFALACTRRRQVNGTARAREVESVGKLKKLSIQEKKG